MASRRRLNTLDLFSGIGGFALSLKAVSKVVGYCELSEDCRKVLTKAISKRQIDKAPIFQDVTRLTKNELPANVEMITAGFPCQDISQGSRTRTGIDGSRSSLFQHVVRLAKELSCVKVIFLENSSLITMRGLQKVITALQAAGFDHLTWSLYSSLEVDAPHERKRWYCLAYRGHEELDLISHRMKPWPKSKVSRVILRESEAARKVIPRYRMLGNAVIPQLTRFAWNSLLNCKSAGFGGQIIDIDGDVINVRQRTAGESLTNNSIEISDGKVMYTKMRWATPSCTWLTAYALTDRSAKVLINQILFEKQTHAYMRQVKPLETSEKPQTVWRVNPQFIEWMMGYPSNWTR